MSSETSRYLQLHFHHAEIPFCDIIGKGYRKIIHESKYLIDLVFQTVEQIFSRGLRSFTSLPRSLFFGGDCAANPCLITSLYRFLNRCRTSAERAFFPSMYAASTVSFISRSNLFILSAHGSLRCSSINTSSRRWCALHKACLHT